MIDPWTLSTTSHDGDRENLLRRGNVFQIANGYMGFRGTLDEFGAKEGVGITLAGLFDQVGDAWREPVNAPNGAFTQVVVDGVPLTALSRRVRKHRQSVHFRNARFERETAFSVKGKVVTLQSERFLSADQPNLGAIRITVTCNKAATLAIRTGIDFDIWDLNGPHLVDLKGSHKSGALLVQSRTSENSRRLCVAETFNPGGQGKEEILHEEKKILRSVTLRMKAGQSYVFEKFFAVFTDNDKVQGPLEAAAVELVLEAARAGYAERLQRHDAHWIRNWSRCDVTIGGDEDSQHALRYSLLQLLMAAPVKGSANSIPARALSGQVYKGAVFWDTEMFMFPFFLHTMPEIAAELLRYRIRTLDGAKRKALTEGPGYRGAFYAWESQETGDDACTYFNIGDPVTGRKLRTYFRDKQVHISGDIAIAMWEYFRVTGDDSILLEGGAEVILECARFFFSYAFFKEEKHQYEMLDVVGPDEYHERVNNNAFTNVVAKETFSIADQAVAHLKKKHPRAFRALVAKLKIASELKRFRDASKHLFIPKPDRTGVIEQFEGYLKLREATPAELSAAKAHPNEYPGALQGLAVPTQVIKQADVVMMLYLFRQRYSEKVKRANWEYYEPRTEHGSSLSACAYALVATEYGNLDVAYKYFCQTAKIDIEAKYKVYVGTIFTGGSHPAANGGAWMTAVLGFGGVSDTGSRLSIRPRLYRGWTKLEFPLASRGGLFRVAITRSTVTLVASSENRRTQVAEIAGKRVRCVPGKSISVSYGKNALTARAAR